MKKTIHSELTQKSELGRIVFFFFLENLLEFQSFAFMPRVGNLKNNMNIVKNNTMRC